MIQPYTYHTPATAEEAAALLQGGGTALAGGTDLIPLLKWESRPVDALVSLDRLAELRSIRLEGRELHIGAMATLDAVQRHPLVQRHFPAVAYAARCVASPQIRSVGTIGGNILQDRRCLYFNQSWEWRQSIAPCFKTGGAVCHQAPASPVCRAPYYSDVATALVACGATAQLLGQSPLPVGALCRQHSAANATSRREDRLLLAFRLPIPTGHAWSGFHKQSVRQSIDFPLFNASAQVIRTGADCTVRLAAGAVAGEPVPLPQTADWITQHCGRLPDLQEELLDTAVAEIRAHAVLVQEHTVTVRAKRAAFGSIAELLDGVAGFLAQ